jgi:hypothetical protein
MRREEERVDVIAMTSEGFSARGATTEELVAESGEGDLLPAEELDEIEPYAEATEVEPGWTDDEGEAE